MRLLWNLRASRDRALASEPGGRARIDEMAQYDQTRVALAVTTTEPETKSG